MQNSKYALPQLDLDNLQELVTDLAEAADEYENTLQALGWQFNNHKKQTKEKMVVAKIILRRQCKLVDTGCVFCDDEQLKIDSFLTQRLLDIYNDPRNQGFHCDTHRDRVHMLLGPWRTWSCCDDCGKGPSQAEQVCNHYERLVTK